MRENNGGVDRKRRPKRYGGDFANYMCGRCGTSSLLLYSVGGRRRGCQFYGNGKNYFLLSPHFSIAFPFLFLKWESVSFSCCSYNVVTSEREGGEYLSNVKWERERAFVFFLLFRLLVNFIISSFSCLKIQFTVYVYV